MVKTKLGDELLEWNGPGSFLSMLHLTEMKSISYRVTIEHKALKVRMNLVCFRKRKCGRRTQMSGEGDELGER